MSTMTRVQAEALAAFVTRLRPEWRSVGIVAAIEKAAPTADAYDVAHALLNLAAEQSVLTPGLLPGPGPHWRRDDGSKPVRRGDHNVACVDHPAEFHPCRMCEVKRTPPPLEDPEYVAAKAALRASRPRHDLTPVSKPIVPLLTKDEREQARQLLPEKEAAQ